MSGRIMAIAAHPGADLHEGAAVARQVERGLTELRYNDYHGSLAVMRGCLANCKYAVALMSIPRGSRAAGAAGGDAVI